MYSETFEALLSVASYFPSKGRQDPSEIPYQDRSSPAEDSVSHCAEGHARGMDRENLHRHRACLEGFSKALNFKVLLLGRD